MASGIATIGPTTTTPISIVAAGSSAAGLPTASPATSTTPASFSALPSSYEGFGTNGSSFGTVGIAGNALAIVKPAASSDPSGTKSSAAADPPAKDPPAKDPPPSDPPAPEPTAFTLQDVATSYQLSSVYERFAIANAQGNSAAATQIKPFAVALTAQLRDQTFAGLGTSPAQPFAQPEIPPVFLNLPT